ncbi:MAG: hypothetical protein DRJ49_01685 [Thermoprotei archaeon]|nr:MAG: hypothetical protein DRN53_03275 [Thermoprotei archaeon]RLE89853.1 MAG: hypothetical protein DRJ49_01685 [Thermoprotei archaeon]
MIKRGYYILWPLYFDKSKSRSEGRRVPKNIAVNRPSAWEVLEAVKSLGFEAILEADKRHPSTWFEDRGCVLVKIDRVEMNKTKLLYRVAKELIKIRAEKGFRRASP